MNQQTRNILFMVSSIAVIIGAAMPLFMLKMPWVPYIYAFGAAGMAVCRLTFRYKGKNLFLGQRDLPADLLQALRPQGHQQP